MILVNGTPSETLPATDRGLAYGDGVFRTLRLRGGKSQAWPHHYRKLEHDCAALAIPCPGEALLRSEIARVAEQEPDGVAKVIVTRGAGQRGYAIPSSVQPTRIVMSFPLPAYYADPDRAGVKARICTLRLAHQPALAGIKHLNRLENVLARSEWDDPQVAEGFMLDACENVIGGTMTNVFMVENGALVTPELTRAGVAGVTRERILKHAAESGAACRVEQIAVERLLRADEVFVVNSVIGVWPVRDLAGKIWRAGAYTARVKRWLDEERD